MRVIAFGRMFWERRKTQMRDAKLLVGLIVCSGLLLLVVPWWMAVGAFVVGYIVLGHIMRKRVFPEIPTLQDSICAPISARRGA
jgi:hypothetical protein